MFNKKQISENGFDIVEETGASGEKRIRAHKCMSTFRVFLATTDKIGHIVHMYFNHITSVDYMPELEYLAFDTDSDRQIITSFKEVRADGDEDLVVLLK